MNITSNGRNKNLVAPYTIQKNTVLIRYNEKNFRGILVKIYKECKQRESVGETSEKPKITYSIKW